MPAGVEQIGENIYRRSGSIGSNVYFLDFSRKAIIDTGHPSETKEIIQDFRRFGLDIESCEYILNTHSHGDHVGGNAFFRRKYTDSRILGTPKTIEITALAEEISLYEGLLDAYDSYDIDFFISDGDRIDLGEIELTVHETPGHADDSLSFYIPTRKILFSGDVCYRNIVAHLDLLNNPYESLSKLKRTYKNLLKMDIVAMAPGHGAVIMNPHEELRTLLKKIERYETKPELVMIHVFITLIEYYLHNHRHKTCTISDLKSFIRHKIHSLGNKDFIKENSGMNFEDIFDKAIITMDCMEAIEVNNGELKLNHALNFAIK